MSFDLRIESNDLALNPDGTVQTVSNNEKLAQDIVKAILTPLGSNPFHQWYGSLLSERAIGQAFGPEQVAVEAERAIQDTLSDLVALQKAQARTQYVSPGEQIAAILEVSVLQERTDPRQFQVTVSVLTRQLTTVEETFQLRV